PRRAAGPRRAVPDLLVAPVVHRALGQGASAGVHPGRSGARRGHRLARVLPARGDRLELGTGRPGWRRDRCDRAARAEPRRRPADGSIVEAALSAAGSAPEGTRAVVALEGAPTRALSSALRKQLGMPKERVHALAYWKRR